MRTQEEPGAIRRIFLPLVALIGLSVAITWWLSTPEQRQQYLVGLRLADPDVITSEHPLPDITARSPLHDVRPAAACRPPTRDPADVEAHPVYRWRGKHDEWVFSDRPRSGASAEDLSDRYRPHEQFARVEVRGEGSRFPARMHFVIGGDVQQMSRILRGALDLPVRQIDLHIELHGGRETFAASSGRASTLGSNVRGFYQQGTNRVAILEQPGFEATRQVARHEASHAMLAGMYGPTPIWLNEGLAEVMTRLEVTGQLRELLPHEGHAERLQRQFRAGGAGALRRLLRHDHESWRLYPTEVTYSHAWGLVYELLRDDTGRTLLQAVFAAQEAAPCRAIDSAILIERHYPGGLAALETRWLRRASSGEWGPALRY